MKNKNKWPKTSKLLQNSTLLCQESQYQSFIFPFTGSFTRPHVSFPVPLKHSLQHVGWCSFSLPLPPTTSLGLCKSQISAILAVGRTSSCPNWRHTLLSHWLFCPFSKSAILTIELKRHEKINLRYLIRINSITVAWILNGNINIKHWLYRTLLLL